LKNVLFIKFGGEKTKSGCTSTSDHGGVFIAQLNELLSELLFGGSSSWIDLVEKMTRTLSLREPFSCCKLDYKRSVVILDLSIT